MDFLIRGSDYLSRYENFRLVGRDNDLQRLISVLIRKHSNSVILMGPGGVGCTALCVGIQAAKKDPDAPFDILRKRLFWLDTDALFALGDGEKINHAFHRIMGRLDTTNESILVVEDTKDLIEACRNNGTMHFMNALLVAVRNNRTQIIFETKEEDLESVLKCHSDMRELFTILPVEEPLGDNLLQIVKTACESLQKHHGIPIADEAIQAAIEYTNRYQTQDAGLSRAQPERSITLLDRAMSSYRIEIHRQPPQFTPEEWLPKQKELRRLNLEQRDAEHQISEYEDEIDKLRHREEEISHPSPDNARTSIFQNSNFQTPEVAALNSKKRQLNAEIDKIKASLSAIMDEVNAGLLLDRKMVGREFSKISRISLEKLDQNELAKLKSLDSALSARIFSQQEVITRVSNGIKVFRVGRRNKGKPLPFLFLGPSGVGKTEVAKVVTEIMLDDPNAITRFDMSEYMEKHSVAKLIGAPPGYEGFEAGGILTNLMRRNTYRVILFDEIEKAHPDVFNILLQVLDEGRLTDNMGRLARFEDAIIIMTTNIGQPHFLDETMTEEQAAAAAVTDLGNTYRGEFLNRFNGRQNIICFRKLDLPAMEKIVRRELKSINDTYIEKGIGVVEADDNVVPLFCRDQYDPTIGARGLPGFITANLEPAIVDAILENPDIKAKAEINYDAEHRRFDVDIEEIREAA